MFGLFKRKKEKEAPAPKSEALQALAAEFQPEELKILAVTGPTPFGGGKVDGEDLWRASIGLTAWLDEYDDQEIHQEGVQLMTLANEELLSYLRQRVPRDFIIKCKARLSKDGKRLLLSDLPTPGFHPRLKAILDEQKKTVTCQVEGLGTFTLNRSAGWFQAELPWLEDTVTVSFDRGEPAQMKGAQDTARALLADAPDWDARIRAFAAQELAELAGDWAQGEEDGQEEPVSITREEFMARLAPDAIQVEAGGGFTFWFGDGEMIWGHSIQVSGALADGPREAQMEG